MRTARFAPPSLLLPIAAGAVLYACSTPQREGGSATTSAPPTAIVKNGDGALATLRAFPTFASVANGGRLTRDSRGFQLASASSGFGADGVRAIAPAVATGAVHIESTREAGAWIDVAPVELAAVEGHAIDRAVVYPEVAADVDLVQVLAADHVEELRVLTGPRARTTAKYRVRLGPGVTELRAREGHVEAVAPNGYVHLATEPMFAVDAKGVRRDVAVRVDRNGDDWTFESSFDATGLAYPIAVDPVWTPVASMATPRTRHSTIVVGTYVLAVGGVNASNVTLNTAERYNTATNTWSTAGSFTDVRAEATVTLLESTGRVLVVGGIETGAPTPYKATAQLYNPTTNTWSSAGTLPVGMYKNSLTYIPPSGSIPAKVLLVGGYGTVATTSNAYLYTVLTNSWTAENVVPDAPTPHVRAGAAVLGNATLGYDVLVSGGQIPTGVSGATEVFVPNATTGTWITKGALGTPRMDHVAVAVSASTVIAVGGRAGGSGIASAERYITTLNSWGAAGSMATARTQPSAVLLGTNRILAIGGDGSSGSADLMDLAALTWAPVTSMPAGRLDATLVELSSTSALVVGGTVSGAASASVLRYVTPTLGAACTTATDCPFMGGCVDGVCCNTACDTACAACSAAKKGGGTDGTCGPIANGSDPDTECQPKSCTIGSAAETNKFVCNGAGACRANGTTPCGAGYLCNSAGTACFTSCTTDANCATAYHCAAGVCKADGANGAACTAGSQCTSNYCVDGVCCDTDCIGECRACTAKKKGSGVDGACGQIAADSDPDNECVRDPGFPNSCLSDGFCNGMGACRAFAKTSVSCGATTCTSAKVTGKLCNGLGVCADSSGIDCAPYGCSGAACATTCAADSECAANAFCTSSGTCEVKKPNGGACAAAKECTSNSCTDGVCCNTDCAAQCAACDLPGKEGTCVPVAGKPHGARAACSGEGTACGGSCDGVTAVTCYYPLPTTTCGGACTDGKQTKNACDGKGACVENSSTSCGAYKCGDSACRETCATDDECATGYRCSANACIPAGGSTCVDDVTAKSGDTVTPCAPFRCESGACAKVCQTSDSCSPGFICNNATKVCESAPAAATEDSGGCSVGTAGRTNGAGYALLAGALALVVASRRRRAARTA